MLTALIIVYRNVNSDKENACLVGAYSNSEYDFLYVQSAVTHSNNDDKTFEMLTWRAPPPGTGPITFW